MTEWQSDVELPTKWAFGFHKESRSGLAYRFNFTNTDITDIGISTDTDMPTLV